MISQSKSESEAIRFIASDSDLIEISYVCDLDWPTILMKGNTLETIRVARFGLID